MTVLIGAGRVARPASAMLLLTMLAGSLPAVASAQVLDTVIRLPNRTVDVVQGPGSTLYFYCNGQPNHALYVYDCSTRAVRRTITLDGSGFGRCHAYNWRRNKLYLRGSRSDTGLYVIDCSTDSVIRRAYCPGVRSLAYNSTSDRIYAAADVGFVYDCATDELVDTVPRPCGQYYATWDSVGNKLYAGGYFNSSMLYATDCSTNSVVRRVDIGILWAEDAAISTVRRRLYVAQLGNDDGVIVLDCDADSVVARLPLGSSQSPPACNEPEEKAYWACEFADCDSIAVMDMTSDTILRWLKAPHVGSSYIYAIDIAAWSNRFYSTWSCDDSTGTTRYWVYAWDCSADTLVGAAECHGRGNNVLCNPYDQKVYVACLADSAVYVFRDELAGIAEARAAPVKKLRIHPNPARDWLELESSAPADLFSTDGRRVATLAPGRNDVRALPAGVYFCRPAGVSTAPSRKLVLRRGRE